MELLRSSGINILVVFSDIPVFCLDYKLPTTKNIRTRNSDITKSSLNLAEVKFYGVEMNVVPRSTGNTNSGTRELTLKCKLKCYFKPMNNPLGVSPSKGKQGTTRGKEKIF